MLSNAFAKKFAMGFSIALMLLIGATVSAAPISLDMNAGWKATFDPAGPDPRPYPCPINVCPDIVNSGTAFEAAMPGWNNVGFNDSAWASYTPDGGGNWYPADGHVTPFYLRKSFTLGTPTAGNFSIVVDDDFRVWVNGTLVLDDHSYGCCTNGTANLLPYLHSGENVIAVKAENAPGGGYWISFDGSVDSTPVSAPVSTPEPMSLSLLGLGLAGLSLSLRKKAS